MVHVGNVEKALDLGDLDGARRALSWVVGRDTAALDAEAVRRALIETMAENFADGLAAPLFYLALGGPVLAWAYKAVNTLDSMVGYKNARYLHLGRFPARLDDAANYLPSRLAALVLVAAARLIGLDHLAAYRLWRSEGRFHTSPNSGQTEAAMAGALGVQLGGSSSYGGLTVAKPIIGQGGGPATKAAVASAGRLVAAATLLAAALAAAVQLAIASAAGAAPGWGLGG
jgi:adenosylcobinamide-phosphate synthase